MGEVSEIKDYKLWDEFVENSPQGTVFSSTTWMKLFDKPFSIYGYFKKDVLTGGIAVFEEKLNRLGSCFSGGVHTPLTPFQGILSIPSNGKFTSEISLHKEISKELIKTLDAIYRVKHITNHYTFPDIRPFTWAGYQQNVRYTYIADLTDITKLWNKLEKTTRYEINKSRKKGVEIREGSLGEFDALYQETFESKGIERPISGEFFRNLWFSTIPFKLHMTDEAGVFMITDNKRAYYILGARKEGGTSSLCLWTALEDLAKETKEVDLVGANDETISLFKRGFATELKPYYGVSKI